MEQDLKCPLHHLQDLLQNQYTLTIKTMTVEAMMMVSLLWDPATLKVDTLTDTPVALKVDMQDPVENSLVLAILMVDLGLHMSDQRAKLSSCPPRLWI